MWPFERGSAALAVAALVALWSATPACLDPLVDDGVSGRLYVLDPGSDVALVDDDPTIAEQIAAEDGIAGDVVPIITAFGAGEPVLTWDFGTAPAAVAPIWIPVRPAADGPFVVGDVTYAPTGHGNIIDVVPGDPGYSPYWEVRLVPLTDAYQGEILSSGAAVEEAVRLGLAEPPLPLPMVADCPVVLSHVTLQTPADVTAPELVGGYYRGHRVTYFGLGVYEAWPDGTIPSPPLYELRREGGEPLSEPIRGVDLTRDGDLDDTHDILGAIPGDRAYAGLFTAVELVVPAGTTSIDDLWRQDANLTIVLRAAADVVDEAGNFRPDRVVAAYPSERLLHRVVVPPAAPPADPEVP